MTSDELYHHGVLGMKWGVRKNNTGHSNYSLAKKSSKSVKLQQNSVPITAKFLSKIFPSVAKSMNNYKDYQIKNKEGTKVGTITTNRESSNSINIVWLQIDNKYGGKGYGQSAMKETIKDAKKNGYKQMTLEVPTTSPNARHIYEKLGFKEIGEKMIGDDNDFWGGLTRMKLDL